MSRSVLFRMNALLIALAVVLLCTTIYVANVSASTAIRIKAQRRQMGALERQLVSVEKKAVAFLEMDVLERSANQIGLTATITNRSVMFRDIGMAMNENDTSNN